MRQTLILFALMVCLLGGQAWATELPREVREAAPEAAELVEILLQDP